MSDLLNIFCEFAAKDCKTVFAVALSLRTFDKIFHLHRSKALSGQHSSYQTPMAKCHWKIEGPTRSTSERFSSKRASIGPQVLAS